MDNNLKELASLMDRGALTQLPMGHFGGGGGTPLGLLCDADGFSSGSWVSVLLSGYVLRLWSRPWQAAVSVCAYKRWGTGPFMRIAAIADVTPY